MSVAELFNASNKYSGAPIAAAALLLINLPTSVPAAAASSATIFPSYQVFMLLAWAFENKLALGSFNIALYLSDSLAFAIRASLRNLFLSASRAASSCCLSASAIAAANSSSRVFVSCSPLIPSILTLSASDS